MRLTRHLNSKALDSKNVMDALHFVGGARVHLNAGQIFNVVEPRSGKTLTKCHAATPSDVSNAVNTAHKALPLWAAMSWTERSDVLRKTAKLLRKHCEEIARWESIDNGKPISEARMDVLSCIDTFSYYAGAGQSLVGQHIPLGQDRFAYTKREPLGVVGCIERAQRSKLRPKPRFVKQPAPHLYRHFDSCKLVQSFLRRSIR
ncbi:hypothetical protein OESDEN_16189 [Oesophagostomum dentatum]|uniref:Aldehyde dehydrogenase domain-containing protein n=1 Tax=Oesophagostomum dentatum TaxID=61180 RepID=A0A0B1SJQ0_OESDE|nr:hypothetical protein OESDEN_16189 [Oesophagostomum dentatum]